MSNVRTSNGLCVRLLWWKAKRKLSRIDDEAVLVHNGGCNKRAVNRQVTRPAAKIRVECGCQRKVGAGTKQERRDTGMKNDEGRVGVASLDCCCFESGWPWR